MILFSRTDIIRRALRRGMRKVEPADSLRGVQFQNQLNLFLQNADHQTMEAK